MILALIPAHNEAATVADSISSLRKQTVVPDRIVVIADNCTDNTESVAAATGAEVFVTVDNAYRKAGALNQALDAFLPELVSNDVVVVMDADSALSPTFIEGALDNLHGVVGAVGCLFYGRDERTIVQTIQANEYHRYARELTRRKHMRLNVLTGAGAVFSVHVLKLVKRARADGRLPGEGVYQQTALTEDNELTLAIMSLGYRCVTDKRCVLHTDLPATWRELYVQRLRWRRGAIENLRDHGLNNVTAIHFAKFAWCIIAAVTFWLYIGLMIGNKQSPFVLSPVWTPIFALYVIDKMVSIRGRSLRGIAVAATLPLEMIYDIFQQVVLVKAFVTRSVAWR